MTYFNSLYELSERSYSRLSKRETMCLNLVSLGKTVKESAAIMNISPVTVQEHYKNIRRKLACKTIAQAVYEGVRTGYLLGIKN
jgi:DNA-binding CsgD family transcriptional regulator